MELTPKQTRWLLGWTVLKGLLAIESAESDDESLSRYAASREGSEDRRILATLHAQAVAHENKSAIGHRNNTKVTRADRAFVLLWRHMQAVFAFEETRPNLSPKSRLRFRRTAFLVSGYHLDPAEERRLTETAANSVDDYLIAEGSRRGQRGARENLEKAVGEFLKHVLRKRPKSAKTYNEMKKWFERSFPDGVRRRAFVPPVGLSGLVRWSEILRGRATETDQLMEETVASLADSEVELLRFFMEFVLKEDSAIVADVITEWLRLREFLSRESFGFAELG